VAWVPGHMVTRRSGCSGVTLHAAASQNVDIDDVDLLPFDEEFNFDEEKIVPQEIPDALATPRKPKIIAQRRAAGQKALGSTPGGKFGVDNEETKFEKMAATSSMAELDAAASKLVAKKKAPGAPKAPSTAMQRVPSTGAGRRWLVGRGGAKRKKLEENSRLEKWLMDNGVWISDVADWGREAHGVSLAIETREQTEGEVSGRGLVARRDMELAEEVAKVPLSILLTKNSSRDLFGEEAITEDMSMYSAIALHLMHEAFVMKEKSKWEPYIAVLPSTEEIGASFTWSRSELEQYLDGSPLLNASSFLKRKVMDDFRYLQIRTLNKYPDKFPAKAFTYENYEWAYAILFSRAVRLNFDDLPPFVALVPYIDMINHSPGSQTYITAKMDGVKLPLGMSTEERCAVVLADKYYARYEQIYISYGPKSNGQLLMLYGFSLERNVMDFVEVPMSNAILGCPLEEYKVDYLEARKASVGTSDIKDGLAAALKTQKSWFPLYRDRFTSEMMQYLRLIVLDEEDLGLTEGTEEEVFDAFRKLDLTEPISEIAEKKALTLFRGILVDMFTSYPTTMEEDESLMKDRGMFEMLPKNARNAIRVRYGEKIILEATVVTVDRMLANVQRITDMETKRRKKKDLDSRTFWGRMGVDMNVNDKDFKPISNLDELMDFLEMV